MPRIARGQAATAAQMGAELAQIRREAAARGVSVASCRDRELINLLKKFGGDLDLLLDGLTMNPRPDWMIRKVGPLVCIAPSPPVKTTKGAKT